MCTRVIHVRFHSLLDLVERYFVVSTAQYDFALLLYLQRHQGMR